MNKRIKKKNLKKMLQIAQTNPENIKIVSENEIARKKLHQEIRKLTQKHHIKK